MERLAIKEPAALREVYDLTSAKLFGVCLRISGDRAAAEDILQDVYVKVWQGAKRYDAARASPVTWLCTIARNTAIDWRRSIRQPAIALEEAAETVMDGALSADLKIEQNQNSARIAACLRSLDERQSNAITSAFYGGKTYAELAAKMDVPLGTMKSWVRRGLLNLKKCLGDD